MRRTGLCLWLFVFSLLLVTGTVRDQSPSVRRSASLAGSWLSGHEAKEEPGNRLLAVAHSPVMAVMASEIPVDGAGEPPPWASDVLCAALVATTALFVFLAGCSIGFSAIASLRAALVATVASPLVLGARLDGLDLLDALLLSGVGLCLLRGVRSPTTLPYLAAGLFAALLLAVRVSDGFIAVWALLFAGSMSWSPADRVRSFLSFVASFAPLTVGMIAVGLIAPGEVNGELWHLRFHEMVALGLLSPSFGLAVAWPALLLVALTVPRFLRVCRSESALIAGIFLFVLVRSALGWELSALSWGPPQLVAAIPLLSCFLFPVVEMRRGRAGLIFFRVFFLAGVLMQVLPALYGFRTHVLPVWQQVEPAGWPRMIADPTVAPIRVSYWWLHSAVRRSLQTGADAALPEAPPPGGGAITAEKPWAPDLWALHALSVSLGASPPSGWIHFIPLASFAVAILSALLLLRDARALRDGAARGNTPSSGTHVKPRSGGNGVPGRDGAARDWRLHYAVPAGGPSDGSHPAPTRVRSGNGSGAPRAGPAGVDAPARPAHIRI